jgi:predicted nuclease of restriction endonuclease-like RecB superfamily
MLLQSRIESGVNLRFTMLTGTLVRLRFARNRLIPQYIDEQDPQWRSVAEQLLVVYRAAQGSTHGELEQEVAEAIGDNPTQLVHQGLAKLLEDRCEFDVESSHAPDELREKAFLLAAARRTAGNFDRQTAVADEFSLTADQVDQGLFADLKIEQRLIRFQDCTVEQLLQRYNVALAQAILLRSTGVTIQISGETPARYRQLFRAIKFHRLICDIRSSGTDSFALRLDGPLSLFSATQKYGVQLANFLPTLLQCKRFELKAEVRWGAQRKEKEFLVDSKAGLRSHLPDYGDYVPKELTMFADLFRKQIAAWDISTDTALLPVGTGGYWAPDFVLIQRSSGKQVYLEIMGFWRRTDVEKHYRRLRKELTAPFVLAISEQFNTDETADDTINSSIYLFKKTPLPEEVVRLAERALS